MDSGLTIARYHVNTLLDELLMKTGFAAFAAILVSIFQAIGPLIHVLIMLMVISFCLDFWQAWREHTISRIGINKAVIKVVLYAIGILVVGLTAHAIKTAAGTAFGIDTWFICLICVNESLASLASLSELGFPVPLWIINRLKAFKDDPIKASRKA